MCVLADPDGRRAKGEGGPSGQEAVKESSGYEDQTAGRTALKATAATVLKVWVTLLDTRDGHTQTHTFLYICSLKDTVLVCARAQWCASVRILINMQREMYTHMHAGSVTHTLSHAPPHPLFNQADPLKRARINCQRPCLVV